MSWLGGRNGSGFRFPSIILKSLSFLRGYMTYTLTLSITHLIWLHFFKFDLIIIYCNILLFLLFVRGEAVSKFISKDYFVSPFSPFHSFHSNIRFSLTFSITNILISHTVQDFLRLIFKSHYMVERRNVIKWEEKRIDADTVKKASLLCCWSCKYWCGFSGSTL